MSSSKDKSKDTSTPSGNTGSKKSGRDSIFISYAHEDKEWHDRFSEMLSSRPQTRTWSDKEIKAGDSWEEQILVAINCSKVVLLLLSPHFFRSEYILKVELVKILKEHKADDSLVIYPVVIKPILKTGDFKKLNKFQVAKSTLKKSLLEYNTGDCERIIRDCCEDILGHFQDIDTPNIFERNLRNDVRNAIRHQGYVLAERIAYGDYTVVYRAKRNDRDFAVKVLVNSPLEKKRMSTLSGSSMLSDKEDEFNQKYQKRLDIAKELQSDKTGVFIRQYEQIEGFDKIVVISEFVKGIKLSDVLDPVSGKGKIKLSAVQIRFIFLQICIALSQYQRLGVSNRSKMYYGTITPHDVILVKKTQKDSVSPEYYFPRLSSFRFSQLGLDEDLIRLNCGECSETKVSFEQLTYMVPEFFAQNKYYALSDQYSVALLCLRTLMKEDPVTVEYIADISEKMAFFDDFKGHPKVINPKYQSLYEDQPSLMNILGRMLQKNPKKRFRNFDYAIEQLGKGETLTEHNRWLAKSNYASLIEKPRKWKRIIDTMYAMLNEDPNFREMLKPIKMKDGVVNDRHFTILDRGICAMLNYSELEEDIQPTSLSYLIPIHKNIENISPPDFDTFINAFYEALKRENAFSEESRCAWESALAPALNYLKKEMAKR